MGFCCPRVWWRVIAFSSQGGSILPFLYTNPSNVSGGVYAESTLASGGTPDKHPFLAQRDALVHSTRDRLQHSLSFSAMLHLDEHVQSEKHNMKVPKEEK
jgi:hypothetical protein